MSAFSLNIKDTFEKTSKIKKNIQDYNEMMNIYLKNVSNVDSVWHDFNTEPFLDILKKDKLSINEHINSLTNYIQIVNDYCVKIRQVVDTYFDISNVNMIKYDLKKINSVISILDEIYERIKSNCTILSNLRIPFNFKYKELINTYKDISFNHKNEISKLRRKMINAKFEIENIFSNARAKVNKFDVKQISKDICSYKYKINNISLYNVNNNINNSL